MDHLTCMLDGPADLVFTVDADGRLTQANEAFGRLVGRDAADLAGCALTDLAIAECRRYLDGCLARARAGAALHGIEATFAALGGMNFVLEGSAAPCRQPGAPYVHGAFRDITLRKEAEEALAQHVEELTRSNIELEQLAYVAAHDMQEPLRMVSSYLTLLTRRHRERLDHDAQEFIDFAVDGANRMSQMIRDLMASARLVYAGSLSQPVDMDALMSRVAGTLRGAIDEAHGEVSWETLPVVEGNPTQLGQLLQNLVANALKYRRDVPPRVHVSGGEADGGWSFAVTDNGIGIAPEHSERIFRLFRRLVTRDHVPGAGIGLAVAKRIVERHGGLIRVESEPGRGSTFHFTISRRTPRA